MQHDSGVIRQPIKVDGTATQCVITIDFSLGPTANPVQATTEATRGKLLLRINEASELLSLSRTNLYKLLISGELESIKVGRSRLIPTDSLEDFIRRYRNM